MSSIDPKSIKSVRFGDKQIWPIRREVLDRGYIELIDQMGDDNRPIDAARVSFNKTADQYSEKQNDGLRRFLLEHDHGTPFEHLYFTFRVKAPVIVWWHWVRHRVASYNFISGRYVPFDETEVYVPTEWRLQSKDNKQGSDGVLVEEVGEEYCRRVGALYLDCFELYQDMLDAGVAKEQARLVLPFGACYYEAYVTMNARSLENFLRLRRAGDAQSEIRDYGEALFEILHETCPKTFPK
jgi:thymidylate synthase (FAD)